MLCIEFPLPTPSLNQLQRMHFHAVRQLRDRYERFFRVYANVTNRARPREFKRLTIVRFGQRELDHDNLVGGCKPLIDALERAKLIYSDAPGFLRVEYRQKKARPRGAKTVIAIG